MFRNHADPHGWMIREEGVWRVGKRHWSNTPPKGL